MTRRTIRFRGWWHGLAFVAVAVTGVRAQTQAPDGKKGAQTFATSCSGCHGSDGRGGERAPNIATVRRVVALSDGDLQNILTRGVPGAGMPSFRFLGEPGIADVVAYLRLLQGVGETAGKVAGDPKAGRAVFFGKAGCSRCHMISGEGGFIAPDLSGYGAGLSEAQIRRAIEAPDSHLPQAGSGIVEVRTAAGETVSGVVRNEDNFTLVLQTEDGRFRSYEKAQLAEVRHTSHSLMPKDFGTRLSAQDLQDLISFLVTNSAGASATEHAGEHTPEAK